MKISYKNTRQDFIDFAIHSSYNSEKSSSNSEKSFKNKCVSILIKFLTLSLILLGLSISYDKSNTFLIYFSLLILIIYIIYILSIIINPNIFKDIMLKILVKKANKNIKEESLSHTTLTLNEEGIEFENYALSYKTIWSNIKKAMVTESHIAIYTKYNGDSALLIIPLRAFNKPSEKESFLEIIRQHDVNIVNSIDFKNQKGRKN
ncbi:YcxB family protein [Clostridium sp. MSJ-4]|uniref:YcxB family protein n=1 Tax=Clostridium simiarum TaxID=2841506 RepID=A0ABS6F545_9CLOT|nr:YcxB family protein [Clostridium simiarum]MBU5593388.1 YcxB family protein [Clostridium simiarum]